MKLGEPHSEHLSERKSSELFDIHILLAMSGQSKFERILAFVKCEAPGFVCPTM